MATHVLDICWSPLRTFVLNIPPSRFRHFPVFAGSIWFLTLAALLFTWLGRGMPQYPGQSNPDVAFISDIASFELKPLFLVGATITAAGYVVTICGVHVMRYEPRLSLDRHAAFDPAIDDIDYGESPREDEYYRDNLPDIDSDADDEDEDMITTLRLVSLVSIFASTVAGSALVLLAVMDTARYHRAHAFLLQMCFAALVIQSSGTVIVYTRAVLGLIGHTCHRNSKPSRPSAASFRVGICATMSIVVILIEFGLGFTFIALLAPNNERFRQAGILEWIIAFVGTIYLWLFGGFLDRSPSRILLK